MVLPVSSNESFRAAFHAMEKGIKVERLNTGLELQGQSYGKGSFIVYYSPKRKSDWTDLLEDLPFQPGMISDKREFNSVEVELPRIALVETYFHDMDAGWTRYILDNYHIPFTVLHPADFPSTELTEKFDVIIFPDNAKSILMTGKRKSGDSYYLGSYPPDYVKGMDKKGFENLMTFSERGGIVIAWGRSTGLFEGLLKIKHGDDEEEFQLPFSDISSKLTAEGLFVPGSLVKVNLVDEHQLTLGMPSQVGVFSRGRPVFKTSVPIFDMDRKVIGSYPEKEIVLSGYGAKDEKMGNRAAMIWMKKGKGQFVFYGFNPQFRASTQASFKLLFNAILMDKVE